MTRVGGAPELARDNERKNNNKNRKNKAQRKKTNYINPGNPSLTNNTFYY